MDRDETTRATIGTINQHPTSVSCNLDNIGPGTMIIVSDLTFEWLRKRNSAISQTQSFNRYAASARESGDASGVSSTDTAFCCRTITVCNMPIINASKKAPRIPPPPMVPNDAPKSRSDKSGLKREIMVWPKPILTPRKPPGNKPISPPGIAEIFVRGLLSLELIKPNILNPPKKRVQRRVAAPEKKMNMPSLPRVKKAHVSRAIAMPNNATHLLHLMTNTQQRGTLHNARTNRAAASDFRKTEHVPRNHLGAAICQGHVGCVRVKRNSCISWVFLR